MSERVKKRLPLGIQTFAKIRNKAKNYAYVDKTKLALRLVDADGYRFLSRPRRFGKSLFLDTLAELFKGSKEMFEGLYAYDKWDWETKYPVIKLSLGGCNVSSKEELEEKLRDLVLENASELKVQLTTESTRSSLMFRDLIRRTHDTYNQFVVILIDEYDKPLLDNIECDNLEQIQVALQSFYSEIKDNDAFVKFGFITGISKFSQMSFFSHLNNLTDITLDPAYATITGYTQADLEGVFDEFLEGVDLDEVRRWYNGYNFLGTPVYNPFDVLTFFDQGNVFKNYWWNTGRQSFLTHMLEKRNYYLPNLENIEVGSEILDAFNINDINLVALLWQSGYLTFDTVSQNPISKEFSYKMKVPNLEIQSSLNLLFSNYLTGNLTQDIRPRTDILMALYEHKFDLVEQSIHTLFSSIVYDNYTGNNRCNFEGYYASVIFAYISALGVPVIAEDHSNMGRADMTMFLPNSIIVIEFKIDMPSEAAIEQIKTKKYCEKYANDGRDIYMIGMSFDSEQRNIIEFDWQTFS